MTAYEDLKKELKAAAALGDESPLFAEYGPWLGKMTGDTNAGALDAALDTALVYVELASSTATTTTENTNSKGKTSSSSTSPGVAGHVRVHALTEQVFGNVIDKALSSIKTTTVAKGQVASHLAILLHYHIPALSLSSPIISIRLIP